MLSASVLVVLLSFIFAGKATEFKPTSVTFSSTSETVTVKWKDPTDGPAYLYEVSIVGGDLDQTELLYSNVYEHTFSEGILPSTTYSVKVFAYSLTGNIGFEHDTVETWPGIPGMPIIDEFGFKAEEDKSAISLSWSKPELNGNLETYVLTAFSEGNITKNTTSELRTTLLGPLGNGLYFVELYAVTKPNNNGKGGGRGPTNRIGPINIPPIQRNVDLILSQITMGTIRLQWDFSSINANCGIYSNTIYYNDGNHTHKEILIPASHQYIVKNLALGVQYTFIVSADCVGSTVALTKEVKLTPEEYPPSMPQNVKANVTENSIEVSWSPPASPNGKLGAYRVSIEGETTESKDEEGLTTSFEGLKSLTTYTVTVKAQTTAGYGPAAVITVTTLPNVKDLPKVPKNLQATLKSPTAALVTWEEPEESSLPVTDYLLSFRQPGGNWESVKIYGNTLKHFLTGLQPSSAYELELCAVSQLIKGEPAKTNLSTLVVVPSLPSNIRATQTSADKVSITWDLPASARAEDGVELLLVKSFKGGILQATSTEPTSSGVLPVTGIEPNTVMSFTAQAIRPGPLGGFSEVKQLPDLITWPELPAPPSDLKLQATGQNSLRATWAESSDRALVLKYQITVTADGVRSTETLETTGTEISVENLEIYTDYSVEVAAVGKPNQNGEGSVAGNATKGNVKTWPGPGGIPSDVQGDADEKSITVTWKRPEGRPTGEVNYYEVTVKNKAGTEINNKTPVHGQSLTVQNLDPLTMYTVEVRTQNKPQEGTENGGGLGDPAVVEVETWPGGSLEPTNGKVELLAPLLIKVSWSPPEGLIGTVEAYHVLAKRNEETVRSEEVSGTTTSLHLTQLEPSVMYKIFIQAKIAPNSQGKGGRLGPEVFIDEITTGTTGGGDDLPSASGLSGGAIAGIVIGVLIAVILVILIIVLITRRRSQNAMIDDFQWSEGTGLSYFRDDIEMQSIGGDLESIL